MVINDTGGIVTRLLFFIGRVVKSTPFCSHHREVSLYYYTVVDFFGVITRSSEFLWSRPPTTTKEQRAVIKIIDSYTIRIS